MNWWQVTCSICFIRIFSDSKQWWKHLLFCVTYKHKGEGNKKGLQKRNEKKLDRQHRDIHRIVFASLHGAPKNSNIWSDWSIKDGTSWHKKRQSEKKESLKHSPGLKHKWLAGASQVACLTQDREKKRSQTKFVLNRDMGNEWVQQKDNT